MKSSSDVVFYPPFFLLGELLSINNTRFYSRRQTRYRFRQVILYLSHRDEEQSHLNYQKSLYKSRRLQMFFEIGAFKISQNLL